MELSRLPAVLRAISHGDSDMPLKILVGATAVSFVFAVVMLATMM